MVRFSVRTYQGMHDTGYKCFPLVPPEDVLPSHSSGSTIPAPTKYCVCRFDAKAVSDLPVDLSNRTRRNRLFRTQLYRLKRPSRMFCRGGAVIVYQVYGYKAWKPVQFVCGQRLCVSICTPRGADSCLALLCSACRGR